MRPRLYAAEIASLINEVNDHVARFNEAAALCRGNRTMTKNELTVTSMLQ